MLRLHNPRSTILSQAREAQLNRLIFIALTIILVALVGTMLMETLLYNPRLPVPPPNAAPQPTVPQPPVQQAPAPTSQPTVGPNLGGTTSEQVPNQAAPSEIEKMKALGKAVEKLPKGNIALRAPGKMTVGDQREVRAIVAFDVPMAALREQLGSAPTDQKREGSLSISNDMAATLAGPGFTIESTTPQNQSIAEGNLTVWSWNVTAVQEGEQELEATLWVFVTEGTKSTQLRVESFTQKINVSVRAQTWSEWLESISREVVAVKTILIAIAAILAWFGFKSRKQSSKPTRPSD
jgi:hypothetical protein